MTDSATPRGVWRRFRRRTVLWSLRGFLPGTLIPMGWILGYHRLWISTQWFPYDALLFSDGLRQARIHFWHGSRDARAIVAGAVVSLLSILFLGWIGLRRWRLRSGRRFDLLLPGMAFGTTACLALQPLGSAFGEVWRGDHVWTWLVLDRVRLVSWGAIALGVLASAIRSIHGPAIRIRRLVGAGCALLALGVIGLGPVARALVESEHWRNARHIGTADAFDQFLREHPGSTRLPEIRRRAWDAVLRSPDISHIQWYLRCARTWGDHLDSARRMEARWFANVRRGPWLTRFSDDSAVDAFWRARLPDTAGPYLGPVVIPWSLDVEPADFERQAAALSRISGDDAIAPDSGFAPVDTAAVESALRAVVAPWAPSTLVRLQLNGDTSRHSVVRVRMRPRLALPLDFPPCGQACPTRPPHVGLPSLGYDFEIRLDSGRYGILRRGSIVDSTPPHGWNSDPAASAAERWLDMDREEAWRQRRDASLGSWSDALGRAWKLAPHPIPGISGSGTTPSGQNR